MGIVSLFRRYLFVSWILSLMGMNLNGKSRFVVVALASTLPINTSNRAVFN